MGEKPRGNGKTGFLGHLSAYRLQRCVGSCQRPLTTAGRLSGGQRTKAKLKKATEAGDRSLATGSVIGPRGVSVNVIRCLVFGIGRVRADPCNLAQGSTLS